MVRTEAIPMTTGISVTRRGALRRGGSRAGLHTGLTLIGLVVVFALITPLVSPYGVTEMVSGPFLPPSMEHLLGTDNLGRDSFTRLASAARMSLIISVSATVVGGLIGTAIGLLSAYYGGVADQVLMRVTDLMMSIPAILMALTVRVVFGPGVVPMVGALIIIVVPFFARIVRASALSVREREYVTAAEVAGVPVPVILARHLLPNTLTPVLVQAASAVTLLVLLEAALSYLGQGVQPPDVSAGRMVSDLAPFMTQYPLLVIAPSVLLVMLAIGWNLIADGIQSVLSRGRTGLA